MNGKNIFVFAFLALLAVQSTNSFRLQQNDPRSLNDMVEKAKQLIEKVVEKVTDAFNSALQKVEDLKTQLKAKVHEAIEAGKAMIQEKFKDAMEQIEKIKEAAAKAGVNVQDCLDKNNEELHQIPVNIILKLNQCLTDQGRKITDLVEAAVENIKEIKESVKNLPNDLGKCMSGDNKITCVKDVIISCANNMHSLPSEITDIATKLMDLTTHLQVNLEKCAAMKAIETAKETAVVVGKISTCITDKMNKDLYI